MKNVNDTTPSYDQDKKQPPVGEQHPGNNLNEPSIDPNRGGPQLDSEVMKTDPSAQSVNATGTPSEEKSAVGWNESSAPGASFEEEE